MVMPLNWAPAHRRSMLPSVVLSLLVAVSPVHAQTPAPEGTAKEGCATTRKTEPATPPEKGEASGSKNMGATGWSGGGLGGSHNQTENSGATPSSRSVHPEVARGLDPTKPTNGRLESASACEN